MRNGKERNLWQEKHEQVRKRTGVMTGKARGETREDGQPGKQLEM